MANMTLKDIPPDQIDATLTIKRDQKWIDEAIASGPETPLVRDEMNAIYGRVLNGNGGHRQMIITTSKKLK